MPVVKSLISRVDSRTNQRHSAICNCKISREGNTALLRDQTSLSGALMRPQMAAHYEQADLVTQTAILIAAIALAHAFLDGNKRTALIAGATFLDLNGYQIDVTPLDDALGRKIEAFVVSHESDDVALERLVEWLRSHVTPKP